MAASAVCPQTPLLVGELAGGAAGELAELRGCCDEAVRRMLAADPATVVVVSDGPRTRWYPSGSHGDFGRYGAARIRVGRNTSLATAPGARRYPADHAGAGAQDRAGGEHADTRPGAPDRVGPGAPDRADEGGLPLGQLIGAWLLDRTEFAGRRLGRTAAASLTPERCAALGRELTELTGSEGPVGLLVVGDGSARRTEKAPGYYDQRALPYDGRVAAALAVADVEALASLDPAEAEELMVVGRASWQVLAGAVTGQSWKPELLYHDGPYGVGYFVAVWT